MKSMASQILSKVGGGRKTKVNEADEGSNSKEILIMIRSAVQQLEFLKEQFTDGDIDEQKLYEKCIQVFEAGYNQVKFSYNKKF